MGDHKINVVSNNHDRIVFLNHLIEDLKSLEQMSRNGLIEDDIIRIGAEQEFCLVNAQWQPGNNAAEILADINDPHFTPELAKYNLEINLDPTKLDGKAFSAVEHQLRSLLAKAKSSADKNKSKIVLTGILPTITTHELEMEFMTPERRYYALNDQFLKARGGAFSMYLKGVDELSILHDSVMFEACNTSFQMHLQLNPQDFASSYNWAQAIAGPVLGVSVNAPLLLGKELWSETRIALFKQSIDTRYATVAQTEQEARVSFGNNWVTGDIVDYYKGEVSNFKTILTKDIDKTSLEELNEGRIPKLSALNLLNGTIYRWNRPCYGVGNGRPHIRIENRYIPAGPTVLDEMANFAFWVGLMKGRPKQFDDLPTVMDFREARSNFTRAARTGAESVMNWMGKPIQLDQLVLNELLPIAKDGLELMKIDVADIEKYLNVIKERVSTHTGAKWMRRNYRKLKESRKPYDALIALTAAIHENQNLEHPVSQWKDIKDGEAYSSQPTLVGHIMTREVITADATDIGLIPLQLMKWNNIHHVPVVDTNENLMGLITWRHLEQYWHQVHDPDKLISVNEIMTTRVISVETNTPITQAIGIMKKHEFGCLPVLKGTQLVGIITIKDVVPFAHD